MGNARLLILISATLFASNSFAIIFGSDDRLERYQLKDTAVFRAAESTAALAYRSRFKSVPGNPGALEIDFTVNGNGRIIADASCPSAFVGQPQLVSYCSSTLVGDDLLLTAGHCFERGPTVTKESVCEQTIALFDFAKRAPGDDPIRFAREKIYECKAIEAYSAGTNLDFALIRLDRKVVGRKPLRLSAVDSLKSGDRVLNSGYPKGRPNKTTLTGTYGRGLPDPSRALINVTSEGGSSGSSILNPRTLEIMGVLVSSGCPDLEWDQRKECYFEPTFSNQCDGVTIVLSSVVRNAAGFLIP